MTKRHLILMNALLWSFAAYKILSKGLPCLWEDRRWWIILICLVIAAGCILCSILSRTRVRIDIRSNQIFD